MSEARKTMPSRSLFDPNKETQHVYVHSSNTDIKARFALVRAELAASEKSPRLKAVPAKRARG